MLLSALWLACTDPGTGSTGSAPGPDGGGTTPSDTDTDTDSDTGAPTTTTRDPVAPAAITADCAPTANALRFVCHVTVDPAQAVQIAFAKADGSGVERIHPSDVAATEHDIGLYFMAPETAYTFTASAVAWPDGEVATGTVTTGAVPGDLAARLDVTGASSTRYVGANLPCGDGANAGVWDTETGELLWYQVLDDNGSFGGYQMLTFTEDHTVLGQSGNEVMEVDLYGIDVLRLTEGVDYAEDLHHDLYKHDGLIYVLYHEGANDLDGFQIWDATGAELGRWWGPDWLDVQDSRDWMHTNAIYAVDGYVYLSLYAQNTIVKVDGDLASPTFGEPQWILGGSAPMGLGTDFSIDWSGVSGTDGFAHQHDAHLLADGRLAMLDNAHGRGLVLSIDEVSHTVTADETYDASAGSCGPQGTTRQTAAGNLLVDCAGESIQEYAPGGNAPVWQADVVCATPSGGGGGPGGPGGPSGAERWYALDGW